MKTKLFAMLAVCSLLFSIPMAAQDEPTADHQGRLLEAVQRILELTDLQAQELASLRQSHFEQVHALWTQIRELEQQKAALLSSDNPEPGQVGAIVIQQFGLKQQVQATNQSYHEAALAVLTLEQQEKVAQIQQAVLLAPQGGPLAAFGLIHPPRPHHSFRRLLRQRFGRRFGQSSAMPGGEDHTAPGPVPFRLFPTN